MKSIVRNTALLLFSLIFLNFNIYFSMLDLNWVNYSITFLFFFMVIFFILINKFNFKFPVLYVSIYFIFIIVNAVYILSSNHPFVSDFFYKNIFYFLFFIFLFLLFQKNLNTNLVLNLFKFFIFIIVSLNLVDFFDNGLIFREFPGFEARASGLYINANNSAYAILACLSIIICLSVNKTSWVYYILALFGILLTLSRGGVTIWFFILFSSILLGKISKKDFLISIFFPLFFVFNFYFILQFFEKYSNYYDLLSARLNFLDGNESINSVADDSRYNLLISSLDLFFTNPIWGNGLFSLLEHGSDQLNHNQYLIILTDYGLIGFFLFLLMLTLAYTKKNSIIYVFLFFSAFFTHEFFYSYTYLTVFSFLLASKISLK